MISQKICIIETKIAEIKSILETWTTQITTHQTALNQITDQLEQIKEKIKTNGILK